MNSPNKKRKRLCLITGCSSTGKTTLASSKLFNDFLYLPVHLTQSLSSYEGDKVRNLNDSKFLDVIEDINPWKIKNGRKWYILNRKLFRTYDYRDGSIDIPFLQDLITKILVKWSKHDVLMEGEYISRPSVLSMLVPIAKKLGIDVYVIILYDKFKVIDERCFARRNKHISILHHKRLTKRIFKMARGMLLRSEISGLLIGKAPDITDSGKKNGIFKLFERSKQEGE